MPRSLKVRRNCFETVKTALRNRGFLSQRDLSEDVGTALSTVSKFMNGGAVDRAIFEDICLRLGLDWRDVAAPIGEEQPPSNNALISENSVAATSKYCLDWGEAPRNSTFYGRTDELAQLEQWIVRNQCCLISILGMGGAGKTALSVKLSEQICDRFDAFVWRSLRNAPPLQTLLADLILSFSNQQVASSERLEAQISQLIEFLHERRCLLVLDNVESILQGGERAGHYQEGYESYDELFCRIADGQHGSCLILTSREQMRSLSIRIGDTAPVRSLSLHGLPFMDGKELLSAVGIADANQGFEQLVNTYSGNPLALKIVASTIRSTFGGNISQFLQQRVITYGGIWDLLEQQFDRLSQLEQQVMYWLAINREWVSFKELREDWIPPVSQRQLLEALESLQGRLLIEVSTTGFTQQPVVMEYVTQKLLDNCYQEITTQTLNLFRSHALLKAQSQDYVRDTQARLILQPLAQKLLIALTDQTSVAFLLSQLLDSLRRKPLSYTGYAAGNVINLLNILQVNLSDRDFSNLAIAQADLANTTLHRTNFSGSTLHQSNFTEVFGGVISVAFSPDGGRLAASDARGEIHLWQLHTQQKLLTLSGHKSWVFSFVFSPSGRTLASASDDFVVKLWDLATGRYLQTVKGPANILNAVTFSPDEQSIVWNDQKWTIQLWNVEYPEQQIAFLQGHTLLARSTAFSPDGNTIAVSTQDQTIKLWNLRTGECTQTLSGETALVRLVGFSANGQYLASTSLDYGIRLWDVQRGQCLHILKGHTQGVSQVVFSPDDRYLASSSFDQTVRVWDVETGQCVKTLHGHHKNLMACAFSPDGRHLVSGGGDHAVKLWDLQTGQCLKTLQGYANGVTAIAFSSHPSTEQTILASAHEDKTVKLWDLATGAIVKTLPTQTDLIWGVAFAPGAPTILASANADYTTKLWNWQTGECLQTLRHQNWGWSVAFHPNGQMLATGSYDQTIKLWQTDTGECLKTLQGHRSAVLSVVFSPDGKLLASSGHDQTIRIWHSDTGECIRILEGHGDRVWQVSFSADSQLLVSCSYDETIKLWNPNTGECLRTFRGHQGAVTSICFSPDQQRLISGSFDQTIKIWDIPTGECLKTLRGHVGGILSLLSLPACLLRKTELQPTAPASIGDRDTLIISSGMDGTIKLWHLETGSCIRSLIAPRPYEGMNITNTLGLTEAQRATLKMLGAIEQW
jgi:WD40 repeat protein/transcriptional regulator with XRE-family HTH domain